MPKEQQHVYPTSHNCGVYPTIMGSGVYPTIDFCGAWSDVARRIAHEIKNPLTPIRLAAERLKRKYNQEVSEREMFNKYIDTIARYATDIGKIVEEFANFARMPAPTFSENDIGELVNNAVFSRECVTVNIHFHKDISTMPIIINCDAGQIDQILANILKNAEESIELKSQSGNIYVSASKEDNYAVILVEDDGLGLPSELLDRLTEPYVTNKVKGTGLGLAIVRKIIDHHNGLMQIFNNNYGGATVKILLPTKIIKQTRSIQTFEKFV